MIYFLSLDILKYLWRCYDYHKPPFAATLSSRRANLLLLYNRDWCDELLKHNEFTGHHARRATAVSSPFPSCRQRHATLHRYHDRTHDYTGCYSVCWFYALLSPPHARRRAPVSLTPPRLFQLRSFHRTAWPRTRRLPSLHRHATTTYIILFIRGGNSIISRPLIAFPSVKMILMMLYYFIFEGWKTAMPLGLYMIRRFITISYRLLISLMLWLLYCISWYIIGYWHWAPALPRELHSFHYFLSYAATCFLLKCSASPYFIYRGVYEYTCSRCRYTARMLCPICLL